jgi:two-component system OmpR family response regulator
MADKKMSVFIVDDDPMQAEMTKDTLAKFRNFSILTFGTGEEALKAIRTSGVNPDIVVLDYYLNSKDVDAANGLAVLRKLMELPNDPSVIMVSGQDRIEVAVNCIKYGAFDYVIKNESVFVRLEQVMKKILKERKLVQETKLYKLMFRLAIIGFFGLFLFILYLWLGLGLDILGSKNLGEV